MVAISLVVNLRFSAMVSGSFCAVLALDVKNALKCANENQIKEASADIGVIEYLANLVENYL